MTTTVLLLLGSMVVIVGACELFTNGVEWFGFRLGWSAGAVGSILAAVGTATPESLIPIVAILTGGGSAASQEIGIGAILGAPFLLSTLALFLTGAAVVFFRSSRGRPLDMDVDKAMLTRSLSFFLVAYTIAVAASFLPSGFARVPAVLILVGMYVFFVVLTMREQQEEAEHGELKKLHFCPVGQAPGLVLIVLQILAALGILVLAARVAVAQVEALAIALNVSPLVLTLIIAPIATELPECFNSVIWVGNRKDTLALGNIAGAMVLQSSLLPAMGIALTPWALDIHAMTSSILALVSTAVVFALFRIRGKLSGPTLLGGLVFYVAFVVLVLRLPA